MVKVKWFTSNLKEVDLDNLKHDIEANIDKLMELYSVIADIEAEATLKIHEVKSVNSIREYIDLYILVNSILIRYVTEEVKSNFERIKRITYIGEIEAPKHHL